MFANNSSHDWTIVKLPQNINKAYLCLPSKKYILVPGQGAQGNGAPLKKKAFVLLLVFKNLVKMCNTFVKSQSPKSKRRFVVSRQLKYQDTNCLQLCIVYKPQGPRYVNLAFPCLASDKTIFSWRGGLCQIQIMLTNIERDYSNISIHRS